MATIDIHKTELVWPGKYSDDGTRKEFPRVNLPFQVIEIINESRATREAKQATRQISLFDVYEGKEGDSFEEGWKNKLIWGDNLLVMGSLLEKFAGKIDLIYIDPPFARGADFSFSVQIGENNIDVAKEQSIIEEKAYRDTWGRGLESYLQWFYQTIVLLRELLAENGSIYVHLDWHVGHYAKIVLDEVFGTDHFQNEICWKRATSGSAKARANRFGADHDVIYFMVAEAKKRGVKLLLLHIPREVMEQQAVDKGDVRFFELAYLEMDIQTPQTLTVELTLKDFVIPNTELIPDEVRQKITKWSDYIDYWAIDWDFQHDTFMQGWVTYRTRKNRMLALASDPHTYDQSGKYRILVKVIDIFGNDTSQAFDVELR